MEWFFAFDEKATGWFADMIKVAVLSARKNTTLEPHCIYDGAPTDLTRWLESQGVVIHFDRVPFRDELSTPSVLTRNKGTVYTASHASGAFLRLNAAGHAKGHTFLYTDCDVMFLNDAMSSLKADSLSATPEGSMASFNSGVLLVNRWFFLAHLQGLIAFVRNNGFYHREGASYDQVFLNQYFAKMWAPLPAEMNWRPFNGINEDASVLHFHGPKPHRVNALLAGQKNAGEVDLAKLIRGNEASYSHYCDLFFRTLEERDADAA